MNKFYKFRGVDANSINSLANNELWFSAKDTFNDPFEGVWSINDTLKESDFNLLKGHPAFTNWLAQAYVNSDIKENKKNENLLIIKYLKKEIKSLINIIHGSKILCLSFKEDKKDPIFENLMWSHYAQGLRGFCLVFNEKNLQKDINQASGKRMRAIEVLYPDVPNKLNLSDFLHHYILNNENRNAYIDKLTQTIATKLQAWKYEREVRILSLDYDATYYNYSPSTLEEIVFGEKMSDKNRELLLIILKSKYPNVKIKIAKLIPNTYKLEIKDYAV